MQAHAPVVPGLRRYRRVVKYPISGANVEGKVSLCDGTDMLILGTIAAFGPQGLSTLTTNFGPISPIAPAASTAVTANVAPPGPTPSTASIALAADGTATRPPHSTSSTISIINGTATGSTFPTASTSSTVNVYATGPTTPTASTASINDGATTGPIPAAASTASTANGAITTTTLNFAPVIALTGSNHGLPYELTDLLITFKECKGIFKCIRDVHANTFTQLAIVTLNSHLREALNIGPTTTIAYPTAHMAGTLGFERNGEVLCFTISWIIDHMVEFRIAASTSLKHLW